ncbi:MAG: class I SAM-dependent methyltransferase, partial [Planctomycetaceae bacterium]|nr:class I SAM-dependent methyltransferase [Planctomycetaceae bacterium]
MPASVNHDLAHFWDERFANEGAIWGEGPSPTAHFVQELAQPGRRVLDVGFGYGRDMAFLLKQGHRVCGVDLSHVGQQKAQERLNREGVEAEELKVADYAEHVFPAESFDMIFSHRVAHLLTTPEAIARFAEVTHHLLKPGGVFCLGVRDTRDLQPEDMVQVSPSVYEYKHRPGHRIRYWNEQSFHEVFGTMFDIESLTLATEPESSTRPVPTHLTI